MTHNQIDYWNLRETQGHNRAMERETYRSNKAKEHLSMKEQRETHRANVAKEHLSMSEQRETHRANVAREGFNLSSLAETSRHNLASESLTGTDLNIKSGQLSESTRHNQATELTEQKKMQETKLANDIQKAYNDAKITLEKQKVEAEAYKDQNVSDYYLRQAENLQQKIDSYWDQYYTDRDVKYLELIEKYVKDLTNLWPKVKGAKG